MLVFVFIFMSYDTVLFSVFIILLGGFCAAYFSFVFTFSANTVFLIEGVFFFGFLLEPPQKPKEKDALY